LRVAFAGTPEFALPALEALLEHHDVVGVLTQPDRPSGRGRHLSASPVKILAAAHRLPLLQPESLRDPQARAPLAAWDAEVLIVVAYGLILPPEVLKLPRRGCLNIHASLLPRWRGAAPVQRAILAGDQVTGVTIMTMDEGLDTGPILLKREIGIGAHDTGGSLHAALARLGAAALLAALDGLAAGTLAPQPEVRGAHRLEPPGSEHRAPGAGLRSLARRGDQFGRRAPADPLSRGVSGPIGCDRVYKRREIS